MIELLLPRTDGGVAVQLIAVTAGFAVLTWKLRGRAEWRLVAIGAWISAYALVGVRALH